MGFLTPFFFLIMTEVSVYNVLHNEVELVEFPDEVENHEDDDDDVSLHHVKHDTNKSAYESLDFNDSESMVWRKHQFRRFFQSKGQFWTSSRTTTAWRWILVVLTGLLIAFTGGFVAVFTETLTEWKLESCYKLMEEGNFGAAFFAYQFICMFMAMCAGILCWKEPAAAGSGIPEIKAFLNGVDLSNVVRMPVLVAKVLGMCFSCATGLPLGKEGPMIHAGSIIGAAVSQGNTISVGFDTSWNIFQDMRNDRTKRDFVTFGAAAGVAAAFRAPIGGILFTLEEGASFWSTTTTFRAFICAVITQLTIGLMFPEKATSSAGMFAFGQFHNFYDGRSNFRVYELPIFMLIGCAGGILGALFNHINEMVSKYRIKHINKFKWKRFVELIAITFALSFISFILPLCWQKCTPLPDTTDPDLTIQQIELINNLVRFQCQEGQYNALASLYFTSSDMAMRQLFHFIEMDGQGFSSFGTGPLILFFVPYYLIASVTSGVMCPAGLFVPTLLGGGAFGRLIGHWLNVAFPGYVADSGTYALIGAAALLGGVARMTIAGCIIVLEACGNITYLLPLMIVFASSRYMGNAINECMYDTQIHLKQIPFLEGSLHTLGMLNYHPISEIMVRHVVTLKEIDKVKRVMEVLNTTKHNGFPIVNNEGKLRGLILRKTLCGLLKMKAYSTPVADSKTAEGSIELVQAATVMYDSLERVYPNYPDIRSVKLSDRELDYWLDMRAHLDPSPPTLNEQCSIHRCYTLFRTMGMRHLIVVDGELVVTGIITRMEMNEHHLRHYWEESGEQMQKEMNVDALPPAVVFEPKSTSEFRMRSGSVHSNVTSDTQGEMEAVDPEIARALAELQPSDSPVTTLRKKLT